MSSNSANSYGESTPLFEHDPLFTPAEDHTQDAEDTSDASPQFEITKHGHLRLRANSPKALRESIDAALEEIANRKATQEKLRKLGAKHTPAPCSILITGGRGTGKSIVAQRFQDALRAHQPDMAKHPVEMPGGLLAPKQFDNPPQDVWRVESFDALVQDNYFSLTLQSIIKKKDRVSLAFEGTTDEAQRLLDHAPEFSRIIALEIQLPDYTPDELFDIFEKQFTSHRQRLTAKARARAHHYITSQGLPALHAAPNAYDAINFATQVAAAQYERLHGRPKNNLAAEAREIRGCDVERCLANMPTTTGPSAEAQLDAMVGLDEVKKQITGIAAQAALNVRREQVGLPSIGSSLHMAFLGGPGTGKTQAARTVAKLLHESGAISRGQLVERSRHNLVGRYIGTTAQNVQKALDEARGGVLFIDEAYTLAPTSERDFGHEAIATLIQGMENDRDDLVVILAGYGPEMEQLFASNPGFNSRVSARIEFPDYNELELLDIFRTIADAHSMRLGPGVAERVLALAGTATTQPDFGNARWVRNLFEAVAQRQAVRLATSPGDLSELRIDDIPSPTH